MYTRIISQNGYLTPSTLEKLAHFDEVPRVVEPLDGAPPFAAMLNRDGVHDVDPLCRAVFEVDTDVLAFSTVGVSL